ncbi:MAG: glycosyltransferase family 2 protein [Chloroflexi bacterium]|nr:glycosyltransferase family 2 protein [Chloroflexota bacterium]MCY4248545.1 glycosyltransferase family 2 protein [Chloroflexota bacterium]
MLDLSIIIVSWNVRDLLDACLASLQRARLSLCDADDSLPSAEIIVVDSDSSDGSVDMVRETYPTVQLLPQRQNLGFSRCNNIGLAQARGRFILLLNPDTEVQPSAIGMLIDHLNANPGAGIIGPHTLNSDGSHQSTRRRFPTLWTGILESTWLAGFAPTGVERAYRMLDTANGAVLDVDWVQGSALMLRREVYRAIGGLDEAYTMYSEELDYCRRAKQAGWRVVYHGGAFITHHGGQSSQQAADHTQIHFHTSKLRYFRKHHGIVAYALLRALLLAQFGWQLALESLKSALGHKRDLRAQRVRHYWKVLRSGLKAKS